MPLGKTFNPGRLRERIEIYQRVVTTTAGVSTETWTTLYAQLWSLAEEIRGTKLVEMGAYIDIGQAKFWVRDNAITRGIEPTKHRIVWNGKAWNIQSNVRLVMENAMREIYCVEWIKE